MLGRTATLLTIMFLLGAPAQARQSVVWSKQAGPLCEPPHVFYSPHHVQGRTPCCPTIEGACPGGGACPANGACPVEGVACAPPPASDHPNIILFIADDLGSCHYGSAGECRSVQTGTPIPAPITPNLDLLAGYGAVFPVVHNTASWCFPSLNSILTGRYQRSFNGTRRIAEVYTTVGQAVRRLDGVPDTVPDPYSPDAVVGGYCTLLAGKFAASPGEPGFSARAKTSGRKLGRNDCVAGPQGTPPRCGTAIGQTYAPFSSSRVSDVFNFIDSLLYRNPSPGADAYSVQQFFVWYAPRIPHQALRAPQPVSDYLFGGQSLFPLGGAMSLGRWCAGGQCPAAVQAFNENSFGTVHDFYGSMWWVDDNIRELRRFLAAETAPHCIGANGRSRFDVTSPALCQGSWSGVSPGLDRNTVLVFLADNGWYLPSSKHGFSEDGYRTRMLVFDPRTLPEVPPWNPQGVVLPVPREVSALAHTVDVLPTVVGYADGRPEGVPCARSSDGTACDGHDLRPYLPWAPGGPAAPELLRHAMCGHHTERPTSPTRSRYLLTRPGSVGRCTRLSAPSCATSADCGTGEFCLGEHCAQAAVETACSSTTTCPAGSRCLGGRCRMGPVCLEDADCAALLGPDYGCTAKQTRWCRNDPNVACTANDDCPACPSANGQPVPCSRLCEPRMLKLYVNPGHNAANVPSAQLTDLFLDPDESGLRTRDRLSLVAEMSTSSGPYAPAIRRMNCCLDRWWPEAVASAGTLCTSADACPADLVCE